MCPFRVVDEINQGMDQIYERQVCKRAALPLSIFCTFRLTQSLMLG